MKKSINNTPMKEKTDCSCYCHEIPGGWHLSKCPMNCQQLSEAEQLQQYDKDNKLVKKAFDTVDRMIADEGKQPDQAKKCDTELEAIKKRLVGILSRFDISLPDGNGDPMADSLSYEVRDILASERTISYHNGFVDAMESERERMIEKIKEAMIRVPPTRSHNTKEDSLFNLGLLKAVELFQAEEEDKRYE